MKASSTIVLSLLAAALPVSALAQEKSASADVDRGSVSAVVDRVSVEKDSATATLDTKRHQALNRVNKGESFWLICRGGPSLAISTSGAGPAPAWMNLPPWALISTLIVDFAHSPLPPDRSGRNLQPGQCSPAEFQFSASDPTQLQQVMNLNGQWEQAMKGLPEDTSENVAEKYPDIRNTPPYLRDPNHYWRFGLADGGEPYLQSGGSGFWKPSMYRGLPPASPDARMQDHHTRAWPGATDGSATETTSGSDVARAAGASPAPAEPRICAYARSARLRNSPAAAGLEKQCREAGGTP